MSNDYATIKTNQSSQKFILAKLSPGRFVNPSLVLDSGTTYTMTFPYDVESVFENETELTRVSSSPSAGEFTYNETTNLLTVHLNAAPDSTNAVVVIYNLYYTIERLRVIGKDPTSPNTDLREWEPGVITSPNIQQTIKNVTEGKLTIAASSIIIKNELGDFNEYLTDNDSFYNKKIKVWHVLDDIENIEAVFEGTMTGLRVARTRVTISVKDNLDILNNPASMGDEDLYFTNDVFTNVPTKSTNLPIRYYFGTQSRYDTIPETVTNLTTAQKLDPTKMDEAVCTNFTTNLTTSNNRSWTAGRVSSNGTTDFSFSPSSVDNSDPNFTRLDTSSTISAKITIGDTFEITGSGTYRERVYYVDRSNHYVYITKNASVVATDTVNSNVCPSIAILTFENDVFYPLYGRDYTAVETTLPSGNKRIDITFTNNFEANHAGLTVLDPAAMTVTFKIKPDDANQNHAQVLKEMLDKAGSSTNAASFTAAQSAFAVNAAFSIPTFDELDYSQYFRYVQSLLQSTLGYIYLNSSFEIVYELFAAPSPTETVTNTEIIQGSPTYKVLYEDIVTQIVGFNPHFNASEFVSISSQTGSSNKSRYLHGVNATTRFRHVLEDFTTKIDDHINLRSERRVNYSFQTKGINFDSNLGDDYTLTANDIPGGSDSRSVKIIQIGKSNTQTEIVASDFLDI